MTAAARVNRAGIEHHVSKGAMVGVGSNSKGLEPGGHFDQPLPLETRNPVPQKAKAGRVREVLPKQGRRPNRLLACAHIRQVMREGLPASCLLLALV